MKRILASKEKSSFWPGTTSGRGPNVRNWAPQMTCPKRKMEEEGHAGLAKGLPRAKTDGGGTFRGTNIGLPRSWHDEPTHSAIEQPLVGH